MFMDRALVLASPKMVFENTDRHAVKVNLWVPSQLDNGNEATHVFVHKIIESCTRYRGIPLLMEAKMTFVLEPREQLFAITEDQAILGISTEPV